MATYKHEQDHNIEYERKIDVPMLIGVIMAGVITLAVIVLNEKLI